MPNTLDPRNAVVFKLLFADPRNRELLVSLLNAVLQPPRAIVSVEVVNPEIQREAVDDRGLVLGILALHGDGTRTDVEMQAYGREAMPERALYHWARLFRDGIARGDDFGRRRPCRVVFILAERELPGRRVHSRFRALESHDGGLLSNVLELHTLELPKLAESTGQEPEDAAALDWARFFAANTAEERQRVATQNHDIGKATEALERLSQDPQAQLLVRWREDQLRLHQVELAAVEQRGREEGHEEGREEGIRASIRAICRASGIELTAARETELRTTRGANLASLLEALAERRAWPAER